MPRETVVYRPGHPLANENGMVSVAVAGPPPKHGEAPMVMSDIEPYRTVAGDIAAGGGRAVIGGRRQHREFLKRNGYTEVGNEKPVPRPQELSRGDRITDIRRALGDL